jgi:uncharacterized membrane protein
MVGHDHPQPKSNFRKFFLRGLGILLPTVLTIWIVIAAYGFVQNRIAKPINAGVRHLVVYTTPWPSLTEEKQLEILTETTTSNRRAAAELAARRQVLEGWWDKYAFPMDMIGLLIAVALIYMAGVVVGSFIGRRLYSRGEMIVQRLPLIKQVYPSVKQVTDFFFGDEGPAQLRFSRVVAVEYPRKGMWSIGLVTGDTMQAIENRANVACLTIFVPSSPTPFTGYVVTVPRTDTIDLPITIDEALRFTVSGGVVVPAGQRINRAPAIDPAGLPVKA